MNTVDDIFRALKAGVAVRGADLVKQVKGVIVYDVGGKKLTLDLKNAPGNVTDGQTIPNPDLIITVNEEDFLSLASGKLNPQQAFMKGKLKIKGNMAIALKVQNVMDAARKEMGNLPSASSSTTAAASSSSPSVTGKLKSGPIFDAIRIALSNDGANLVKKVAGIIQFTVTQGTPTGTVLACVVLNLKTGKGSISEYSNATSIPTDTKPDLVLTVADDDLHGLGTGSLNAQQAFMKGKLKIKGNMGLAMKMSTVFEAARKGPGAKL